MKVIEMDRIEDIIYNLHLIKTVIPDYTEGRNQSYSDEETEKIAYQAVSQAIEVLQKQIPKKPIEKQLNVNGDLIGLCSVCNEMWVNRYQKYCCRCGQKLDWEE